MAFAGSVYPIETARTVLSRFCAFVSDAPDEVNANVLLWSIPESPAFPPHLHGREVLIAGGMFVGPVAHGEEILRPLRELDEPTLDVSSPTPYVALQELFDPFFGEGELLHYWKALYLDSLDDTVIEAIARGCTERPDRFVGVWALGGAMGPRWGGRNTDWKSYRTISPRDHRELERSEAQRSEHRLGPAALRRDARVLIGKDEPEFFWSR